jgi:hypothetical protein
MGAGSRRLAGDTLEPVTDFIAVADRVVVRDAWRATGQGPDADMEFTRVFTLRKRKIIVVDIFWDHAEPSKPWVCGSSRCRRRT